MISNITAKNLKSFLFKNQAQLYKFQTGAQLFSLISQLTRLQRRVLNYLISFANTHPSVYPSQQTIAAYSGGTREHCNRILKMLQQETHLVRMTYRHRKTSVYVLSDVFSYEPIRKLLSILLPALKRPTIQAALLTALVNSVNCPAGADKIKNLTPYKGDIYINTKYKKESSMWPPKRPQPEPQKAEHSPPLTVHERKIQALERELKHVRAIEALNLPPKATELDERGREYLKRCPELQQLFANILSLK